LEASDCDGDKVGGVTIHFMTAKVDAGGILAQQRVLISDDDTGRTLFQKLCSVGADLLLQTVREIENGSSTVLFPDESAASYFGYPTEADARICWNKPADQIRNLISGSLSTPWRMDAGIRYSHPNPPATLVRVSHPERLERS
jgi:UDP-4-amino-4-deoxy-L-arabinose formyltransferase/UDP-glucuronic acid dehydrogenase (UDP-4-keto-hexauronic acid decarboxylating)